MYACLGGGACDVETLARILASFREWERTSFAIEEVWLQLENVWVIFVVV